MDPLSAFINSEPFQSATHHAESATTVTDNSSADDAEGAAASNLAHAGIAVSSPACRRPSQGSTGSELDDNLSPVGSPQAASPYPASCPVDVPTSGGSSGNCSSADLSSQQHLGDAVAEVSTPISNAHLSRANNRVPVSPPDPELNPEVLEQLLQKASPAIGDSRFSMAEFLKGKAAMTAAARRELVGGADHTLHRPSAEDDDVASSLEGVCQDKQSCISCVAC